MTEAAHTASYTVHLAGTLQAGETATIILTPDQRQTTNSADYANFATEANTAVAATKRTTRPPARWLRWHA